MKIIKDEVSIEQSGSLMLVTLDDKPLINSIGMINGTTNHERKGYGIPVFEFDNCCAWIEFYVDIDKLLKNKNTNAYSYAVKHYVERWLSKRSTSGIDKYSFSQYISNGAAIAAALYCGIDIYTEVDSVNVSFNISQRDISKWNGTFPRVPEEVVK